jgi:hypothetical protein
MELYDIRVTVERMSAVLPLLPAKQRRLAERGGGAS